MIRSIALAALTFATPALAFDIEAMSEPEREAFRAEIRSYLLDNPEVLMEAIGVLEARDQQAQASADAEMLAALSDDINDDGYSWVGGNPEGDITLVEFMDYRCGYCRRAFEPVEGLVAEDGNIRFVLKELPILGEQSLLASQFAIAVKQLEGDDAYKDVHDALMVMNVDVTEDSLTRLAEGLALDPAPILARMDGPEVQAEIDATRALATALQINGTPTFVLADQLVRGFVPAEVMAAEIARIRGE